MCLKHRVARELSAINRSMARVRKTTDEHEWPLKRIEETSGDGLTL
jgi:hypothetical protein